MAHPRRDIARLERLMASWNPTHLIVLGPLTRVIRWGLKTDRRVTCQFADSFEFNPLLRFAKFGRLAKYPQRSAHRLGLQSRNQRLQVPDEAGRGPGQGHPRDWPYQRNPAQTPPREKPPGDAATLLYVGTVQTKKGVGDAIAPWRGSAPKDDRSG